MEQKARREISDIIGAVARHWVWFLWFGVVTIVAGLLLALSPGLSLLFAAVLFGIYLTVSAVFRFISAFSAPHEAAWVRVLFALVAVISLIVGLYLLRHPFFGILVLGVLLGIFWVMSGCIDMFIAIGYRQLPGRWWTLLAGVLSVIAGVIVLADPVLSLRVFAWVLGAFLVVFGIVIVVQSFRIRSLRNRPAA